MPRRAPTTCAHPLCPRTAVHRGRCATHAITYAYASAWSQGARGRPMPAGWQATRRRILDRDRYTCRACGAEATDVDHIIRGAGDHDANLQALCEWCHDAKTQAEAAEARRQARARASGAA